MTPPNPTTHFNLEHALQELAAIVQQLEASEVPLDEAMQLFERGQHLAKLCTRDLDAKELRIRQILDDDSLSLLDG